MEVKSSAINRDKNSNIRSIIESVVKRKSGKSETKTSQLKKVPVSAFLKCNFTVKEFSEMLGK